MKMIICILIEIGIYISLVSSAFSFIDRYVYSDFSQNIVKFLSHITNLLVLWYEKLMITIKYKIRTIVVVFGIFIVVVNVVDILNKLVSGYQINFTGILLLVIFLCSLFLWKVVVNEILLKKFAYLKILIAFIFSIMAIAIPLYTFVPSLQTDIINVGVLYICIFIFLLLPYLLFAFIYLCFLFMKYFIKMISLVFSYLIDILIISSVFFSILGLLEKFLL